jgi:hypothetical protein
MDRRHATDIDKTLGAKSGIIQPESAKQSLLIIRYGWRKVRAPMDRVPGNAWEARAYG